MDVSEARRLKALEDENARLKKLLADTSLFGIRVARELDGLIAWRGKPLMVVSDNGTEFTSMAMLRWSQDHRVEWHYIAPGKPM